MGQNRKSSIFHDHDYENCCKKICNACTSNQMLQDTSFFDLFDFKNIADKYLKSISNSVCP